LLTEQMWTQLG